MKQLFNKKTAKAVSVIFAGVMAAASMAMMTGCDTAHPKVRISVEFQNETYELDYTLYRKMYPSTVRHFIELAENGYYDGMCVHDYEEKFFYTGAFTYNADDVNNGKGGLEYKDYYSTVKGYKTFTQSVFDAATGAGTYTVYGEFTNNGFSVEKNGLSHKYGSLAMYYNDISTCETKVTTNLSSTSGTATKYYKYNSATSEFYIFTGTSNSANNSKYCVFGTIDDEDVLDDLSDAIEDYIDAQDEEYEFTTNYEKVWVDENDAYADKHYVSYNVPNEPIIIKSVKVTRY